MIFVSKFRANDLNSTKGKQIEFNKGVVDTFFGFKNQEEDATFECCSLAAPTVKRTIKVHFTLSPSRGDYKVYQNADGSMDLKDYFLTVLHLTSANINDYFAIKKTGPAKYALFYIPNGQSASTFFNQLSADQLVYMPEGDEGSSDNDSGEENKGTTIQTIYYGCPGTGKSHQVKELTEGLREEKVIKFDDGTTNVFRTTFHPDYDYATFVGCYKPVKENDKLDYKFVPQVFTNAYVTAKKHPETPIYLIIEEINRGNCAQIFGDLFQLLDRENGVSKFPIDAEEELMKYLRDEAKLDDYIKIKLPVNFNIYATMNTSDQSLFPMDSAFKRRWEMKYIKIDYTNKEADYTFNVGGKDYHWLEYLPCINDKITLATDSEDKQMGEFFIRSNMNATEFKNKVMFYLWNDVCKDLYSGKNSPQSFFFRDIYGNPFKFTELFNEPAPDASEEDKKDPRKNGDLLLEGFLYYVKNGKKKAPKTEAITEQTVEEPEEGGEQTAE